MSPRVTIAGLGLIGGSIGKAARKRGWSVAFVDPFVSLEDAQAAGAADEKRERLSAADEFVVLATPVDGAIAYLKELRPAEAGPTSGPALVSSVCSVMAPLREVAANINFIAGHPFAGSERNGLAAADAALFAAKPWFVEREHPLLADLIAACGARMTVVDPAEHDRILAVTSHLPQVLATALGSMMADTDPKFIGPGSRTMLRLAGSSYDVWKPVLDANRATIEQAVRELYAIVTTIKKEDFERAQKLYSAISSRKESKEPDRAN